MTAVVYTSSVVALLIIVRLIFLCRGMFRQRLHTDPLTALPNRQGFEITVAAHLKSGSPFTIVWLGLDGFRRINELRGYRSGDEILSQIGPRIRRHLRPGDAVARFGGDQFLVLLKGHEPAAKIIGQILETMEASAGLSLFPNHADSGLELLELAETAMRQAKVGARGQALVYRPCMAANEFRSTTTADLIRSALANDHFRLVYQPILNRAFDIVRMEALVRLDDPMRGRVPPAAFIGVAEQTGLIHEVGAWVLRRACWQACQWRDAGFQVMVSIRMSPLQLTSEALADGVLCVIAEAGLDPAALAIEVTGEIGSRAGVERLRSADIQVTTHLTTHLTTNQGAEAKPLFDGVKVRAPFKIPDDHPAHVTVIAQGIEETEQLEQARAAGCHLFQGFHLAPPLEPEDATEILRTGLVGRWLSPARDSL